MILYIIMMCLIDKLTFSRQKHTFTFRYIMAFFKTRIGSRTRDVDIFKLNPHILKINSISQLVFNIVFLICEGIYVHTKGKLDLVQLSSKIVLFFLAFSMFAMLRVLCHMY